MSDAIVTVAVDATTQKVLLILAALLVGSTVGLLGALIFGLVAGERGARPRRAPAVRMQAPAVEPLMPQPLGDVPPVPVPAFVTPGIGSVPALFAVDSDVVRERHRDLYDAEYAKQLEHVDTLRRTIGMRIAVDAELELHTSPEEPDA